MNSLQITKRLSRDTNYKQTEKPYQQTLSNEDINKKLIDYKKVKSNDIFKLPLNTHIRYFTINQKTGEKSFRLGGFLSKIDERYIVLYNNNNQSWSVQLSNSIIYKKLSPNDLILKVETETLEKVTSYKDKENEQLEQLMKENKDLKKLIKDIKNTTLENKKKK